ncbi:pirin family protein [Cesiribacter sp. SM1]|uniref:pirin family protein n=1 Tax=Cesiribacter sp. SM1 TaxID=2861196 RepID=UPI001CD7F5BE|nr:pirin family protein [Cesiribacter sp. SM1]
MEKTIITSTYGTRAKVAHLEVNRLLSNRYTQAVGPFVFLDHLLPSQQAPKIPQAPTGEFAHPHRGIATFTYLFSGSLEHYDSNGNHGIVEAGGAQWMKAGNGVIHDENPSPQFQLEGGTLHALQFWINLPAKNKAESPEYLALHPQNVPQLVLPNNAGTLRIIIGTFEDKTSPVKTYSKQFLYHLQLKAGASFTLDTRAGWEYAAFIPQEEVISNSSPHGNSELLVFSPDEAPVIFSNPGAALADIMLFGGEPYREPMVAQGPFIMNSRLEIAEAYEDYFNGRYGQIEYKATAGVQAQF